MPLPERRLAAGRVVLDGPGQDGVEAREGLRPVDEVDDGLRLAPVHPGGDVDEDQAADQLGPPRRQHGRRHAPERHADHRVGLGGQPLDALRHRLGQVVRAVGAVVPPARVAVSRQVEGHERPVQGQGDGVPRVRVHRRAVEEDELRRPDVGAPHERAEGPAARQRHVLPSYARRPGPREPELGGVLLEQAELVVRGRVHGAHHRGGRRLRSGPLVATLALLAACGGSGASSGSASLVPPAQASAPAADDAGPAASDAGATASAGGQPRPRPPPRRGRPAGDRTAPRRLHR